MTMKRILLLFLLFCGGYVHAQELDSARIHFRQGHREVDMLFRDNRARRERVEGGVSRNSYLTDKDNVIRDVEYRFVR